MLEEVEGRLATEDDFEDTELALEHCPIFLSMVEAVQDKKFDPQSVMCDAVRLGLKAGRRLSEIENLEAMVGIGKKYSRRKKS